jgi:hypothetical protein
VSDGRRLAYVSLPQKYAASVENEELCFIDHMPKDVILYMCFPQESKNIHAYVHRSEIIEDILLEQVHFSFQSDYARFQSVDCIDEAC